MQVAGERNEVFHVCVLNCVEHGFAPFAVTIPLIEIDVDEGGDLELHEHDLIRPKLPGGLRRSHLIEEPLFLNSSQHGAAGIFNFGPANGEIALKQLVVAAGRSIAIESFVGNDQIGDGAETEFPIKADGGFPVAVATGRKSHID